MTCAGAGAVSVWAYDAVSAYGEGAPPFLPPGSTHSEEWGSLADPTGDALSSTRRSLWLVAGRFFLPLDPWMRFFFFFFFFFFFVCAMCAGSCCVWAAGAVAVVASAAAGRS